MKRRDSPKSDAQRCGWLTRDSVVDAFWQIGVSEATCYPVEEDEVRRRHSRGARTGTRA